MIYKLKFIHSALKEWEKLDKRLQTQFKKKLSERLQDPHVQTAQLSGYSNHYKIKLRNSGYRLVYEVIDDDLVVMVIVIGKRERSAVYKTLNKRST